VQLRCAAVPAYADASSLLDARRVYFETNGFGADGGYTKRWVKLKLGPLPIVFPNSAARVRAVRYHDLHHVATGYDTDFAGEGEIAAWELASGCREFVAAWWLNLSALGIGLLRWPSRMWRAFLRGRHTENLYGATFDDALLASSVSALKARLGLDRALPAATTVDRTTFAACCGAAVVVLGLQIGLMLAPLWLLIRWIA
jgi:hypothetical protein